MIDREEFHVLNKLNSRERIVTGREEHELPTVFKKIYDLSRRGVLLGAYAKLRDVSYVRHICLYVHLHGVTRLPLDEISSNLIFNFFSKLCWENSSFIKI
jgi:hypothetical protein